LKGGACEKTDRLKNSRPKNEYNLFVILFDNDLTVN
jgi:hypothetical protein